MRTPFVTPETIRLQLPDGAQVEIPCLRHARARRLRLRVGAQGVALTLPPRGSLAQAQAFAQANAAWVATQLARLVQVVSAPLVLHATDTLPLFDAEFPVTWQHGPVTRVMQHEGVLHFQCRGEYLPAAQRALRDFYVAQGQTAARQVIAQWQPGLPRVPARIAFKRLSSLWGSMSHVGHLSLDVSLVMAPRAAFDYVVVHELCHLIHANHSPAFWAEVEARCPEWRTHRAWFRQHGSALKHRAAALLG